MGSLGVESMVYDIKLSSVVPGSMTAENTLHEFSNSDLVMKLHYLKGVYYFDCSAVEGLTPYDLKSPMFEWLEPYYVTCGRIRKSESGRPFVKCNDGGVRIIEAQCSLTLDDCLHDMSSSVHSELVPNQVLGPELGFSPLVLMQLTWFKCGGVSIGISWAHVLGDAFSLIKFINLWGQISAGKHSSKSLNLPKPQVMPAKSLNRPSTVTDLLSIKKIEPEAVNDSWIARNNCRMETFSFQLTATQLEDLQSKISAQSKPGQVPIFETLCALIWQCVAKIRGDSNSKVITTCRNEFHNKKDYSLGNNNIIGVVKADFSITGTEPSELAAYIFKQIIDESTMIEEDVTKDEGLSHFVVYGANLTFVDLEGADLYGLELKGKKPVFANYNIDGVGNEGVVLVLPGPEPVNGLAGRGRILTLILPENEVMEVRNELKGEWGIV